MGRSSTARQLRPLPLRAIEGGAADSSATFPVVIKEGELQHDVPAPPTNRGWSAHGAPPPAEAWEEEPTRLHGPGTSSRLRAVPNPPSPKASPRRSPEPPADSVEACLQGGVAQPAEVAAAFLRVTEALGGHSRALIDGSRRYIVIGPDPDAVGGETELALLCPAAAPPRPCVLRWLRLSEIAMPELRRARFMAEAQIGTFMTDERVTQILGHGEIDGALYTCRELPEGRPLSRVARGKLSVPGIVTLGIRILETLDAAHGLASSDGKPLSVIHGEIGPSTVFINSKGWPTLTELSVAQLDGTPLRPPAEARTGLAGYSSPEQHFGQPLDARTDLFSLGVLMAELISGQPVGPLDQSWLGAFPERIRNHCSARPGLPATLVAIIEAMTALRPADRAEDARAVIGALTQVRKIVGDWDHPERELRPVRGPLKRAPVAPSVARSSIPMHRSWVAPASVRVRRSRGVADPAEPTSAPNFEFDLQDGEDIHPGAAPLVVRDRRSSVLSAARPNRASAAHAGGRAREVDRRSAASTPLARLRRSSVVSFIDGAAQRVGFGGDAAEEKTRALGTPPPVSVPHRSSIVSSQAPANTEFEIAAREDDAHAPGSVPLVVRERPSINVAPPGPASPNAPGPKDFEVAAHSADTNAPGSVPLVVRPRPSVVDFRPLPPPDNGFDEDICLDCEIDAVANDTHAPGSVPLVVRQQPSRASFMPPAPDSPSATPADFEIDAHVDDSHAPGSVPLVVRQRPSSIVTSPAFDAPELGSGSPPPPAARMPRGRPPAMSRAPRPPAPPSPPPAASRTPQPAATQRLRLVEVDGRSSIVDPWDDLEKTCGG